MPERIFKSEEIGQKLASRNFVRMRGLDSYSTSLGFSIDTFAYGLVRAQGSFTWYDMCCGYFNAGKTLSNNLANKFKDLNEKIIIRGIDLDTRNNNIQELEPYAAIEFGNVVDYDLPGNIDLITCLKSLRYVDEFTESVPQALEHWYGNLKVGGLLAVEIDWINSLYQGRDFLEFIQDKLWDHANFQVYEDYPDVASKETSAVMQITKRSSKPLGLI